MKILVVQDRLRSGGTERQALLLTRGFRDAGHPATLLTFRPGGALAPQARDLDHRVLQPVDLHLDWFAPRLLTTARHLTPDIVVCLGRMANCHGTRLQRALPTARVIATLRTGKPLPYLFRRSLHHVAHVVANSHEAAAVLTGVHAVPSARVAVIPNALVFPPSAPRPAPALAPRPVTLLCVAMFRPEKNQRALLDLVARLPDHLPPWQLVLAGDGPALAACRAHATTLGLGERVRFLGFQTDPSALYATADLAVLTSRSEALSNFLIEAQAHGLPTVAYAARGVPETMQPGLSGQVIPMDDADAFVQVLADLIASPARRATMSAAARTFALNQFSPTRQIHAYLDLFARLRASSPR